MKNGWPLKSVGELCVLRPPKAEARNRLAIDDEVSFLPMEDLGINVKHPTPTKARPLAEVEGSYTYFADGDVLLAKITPCFQNGKLGIATRLRNGIGFGSSEFFVLRPNAELDREYLYYFLSRPDFRTQGTERMGGAVGQQRVPPEFLLSQRMILPPIPEQRRIVGILDEAFDGIATAKANSEKNLQNARALFESHLQAVFIRRPDEVPLLELASEVTDGDHSPPPKAPTGVPFITISDIVKRTREVDFSNTFTVPAEYFRNLKPNKRPRIGDILYTVTGATLGIPVLVKEQRDFCFQRHIGLVRPKPDTDSAWLTYALLSPQVFRQATIGSTGTAQKTVSLSVLRGLKVPKLDLAEQRHIAVRLDSLAADTQRLESLYQRKLDALDDLKKSLLHRAFSGQL